MNVGEPFLLEVLPFGGNSQDSKPEFKAALIECYRLKYVSNLAKVDGEAVVSSSSFAGDISVVICVKPERQGFQRANSAEDANAASFRVQMHIIFMSSPRSENNARYLLWVQLGPSLIIRVPDRSVYACRTSSKQFILLFFSIPACSLKTINDFCCESTLRISKKKTTSPLT